MLINKIRKALRFHKYKRVKQTHMYSYFECQLCGKRKYTFNGVYIAYQSLDHDWLNYN